MDILASITTSLTGLISLLKDTAIARQLGLVNVDSVTFNFLLDDRISIVNVTGATQKAADAATPPPQGTAVFKCDLQQAPKHEAEDAPAPTDMKMKEEVEPMPPLPIQFGTYICFDDPKWWEIAPDFVDIAPSIRVVSISRHRHSIPRIGRRDGLYKIKINYEADAISVRVGRKSDKVPNFEEICPKEKPIAHFPALDKDKPKWSLHRIRANQITELPSSTSKAVMHYSQKFAECAWLLVHRHRYRGYQAYILLLKRGLSDD